MKYHFSFILAVLALSFLMPCRAGRGAAVDDLMRQGDIYDQRFEPKAALEWYLPAEKQDPKNVTLLLCIARQYRHLMADSATVPEKLRLGGIGRDYAERAAALAPKESEAHLSIAISLAKMLPLLGNKEKLEASHRVKSAVDTAIALDPTKDLAWHILGCWHQRLADIGMVKRTMVKLVYGGLPDATNDDAVKCFRKAIELNPTRLIHYIELGRTYAQMGQASEARRFISEGLAMPNTGKDDPEVKQRGRETLGALR